MAKNIKFVCDSDGCPNQGIDYFWDDANETHAQCGGCGTTLEAQDA